MKFVQVGNDDKDGRKDFVNLDCIPYIEINLRLFGKKYHSLTCGQSGSSREIAKVFEDEHGFQEILDHLGVK